jgi:Flp pilus assembly protein TadD
MSHQTPHALIALLTDGRWAEAIVAYKLELQKQPENCNLLLGISIAAIQLQQFELARRTAEKALTICPDWEPAILALSDTHAGLGKAAIHQANWSNACYHLQKAIRLRAGIGELHCNLSFALLRMREAQKAFEHSLKALRLLPNRAEVHNTHGTVLQELGRLDEAELHYHKTIELDESHSHARSNLGTLYHQRGALELAIQSYRLHLKQFPKDRRTQVNLAGSLLLNANYEDGWYHYESRLEEPTTIIQIPAHLPRWPGPNHQCQELVLLHEQGFGDSFQFIRYALLMRPYAQKISYKGPKQLHQLVMQSGLVDTCYELNYKWNKTSLSGLVCWEALLSIPNKLGGSPVKPIISSPYLKADPTRQAHWTQQLQGQGPLIGIHWQGNPEHEMTISRGRSFPLETLAPLSTVTGIRLLSLQKGAGQEQLKGCTFRECFDRNQPLVDKTWDFAETAAILQACDLVISSDSGLAHLAAGLGRPTWILLMHIPEWRWGLQGEKTPWYQNTRLWRQKNHHDWDEVVQRLLPELRHWCKSHVGMKV